MALIDTPLTDEQPRIFTAQLAPPLEAQLNRLRTAYFPAERNYLRAHLTLFHAIMPDMLSEMAVLLHEATAALPLRVRAKAPVFMGRGFAVPIECNALVAMHKRWRRALGTQLSTQDAQGLWPHVTLQNKVASATAREDFERAKAEFLPQPSEIIGFQQWRYCGGPWAFEKQFGAAPPSDSQDEPFV